MDCVWCMLLQQTVEAEKFLSRSYLQQPHVESAAYLDEPLVLTTPRYTSFYDTSWCPLTTLSPFVLHLSVPRCCIGIYDVDIFKQFDKFILVKRISSSD